ncbi:M50 family metallopeptidase [Massilia glaciei]|uniref:M50 family metallopeptidase n=1 Tax=Massilia glaciei TaxID=1524097 RepID=UPI0015E821BA|nr:M50 family metallopeptidase [Massilia glaciei]
MNIFKDARVVATLFGFAIFGGVVSHLRQTPFLLPVDLYLVAWHESMHALGAWLSGGTVHSIEVRAHDGVTWTSGGFFPLIAMAGYVGTSLWGASLLASARRPKLILPMRLLTVALPPLAMLFGNGISLSMVAVIAISAGLFFAWRLFPSPVTFVVSGLFASDSWRDVQMYLFSVPGKTDAGILAGHLGMQFLTLPIALSMALMSVFIWWTAFKYTHPPRSDHRSPSAPEIKV